MSAIFISHSSKDNDVTKEVLAELEEQGHRSIFLDFDPVDGIPAGRNWEKELYTRLRGCRAVIVLCSEESMASDWCFAEITHAKSLGKHIFPIKVAPCSLRSVLTDVQVLDLSGDREDAYRRLEHGLLVAGLDPRNFFDWDGSRPPYPGLLAFQEPDAAVFFGREADVQQGLDLLNRLQRFGGARLAVFLGASGSGKSSLVRAGLVPRLKRDTDRWLMVDPFRPLQNPARQLALVLSDAFKRYESPRDWKGIRDLLDAAAARPEPDGRELIELVEELRIAAGQRQASVVLVMDQVEELLGYASEDRAAGFLPMLRDALESADSPLMVLGTLRSDFLGDFQNYPALRELAFESLTVGPLSADGFAQVIEGPAAVAGLELDAGLVQAMVADTETHDALPLLAFTLRELYERHGAEGQLTVKQYRELGGLEGSVARAAESVIAAKPLSAEEQEDLRSAFVSMVRINDEGHYARRPARWGDLPQRSHSLLERFVAARLLVSRSDDQDRVVEVAHEALFRAWEQLNGWLDEDWDSIRLRDGIRKAAEEWDAGGRESQLLVHRGARLEAAETLARQPRFEVDALAREYVQGCVDLRQAELDAQQEQERREREALERLAAEQTRRAEEQARAASKLKKWFMGATAVGLLAMAASIIAWWQWGKAETARARADKNLGVAKDAVDEMLAKVGSESLKDVPQMEQVRVALLAKASKLYSRLSSEQDADSDSLQREQAQSHYSLGEIYRILDDRARARDEYQLAADQFAELLDSSEQPQYRLELAKTYNKFGWLLSKSTEPEVRAEAAGKYASALEQFDLLDDDVQQQIEYRAQKAVTLNNRGVLRVNMQQEGEAKKDFDALIDLLSPYKTEAASSDALKLCSRYLAYAYNNRAMILEASAEEQQHAISDYTEAIAIIESLHNQFPKDRELQLELAKWYNNLAGVHRDASDYDKADEYNAKALGLFERLAAAAPNVRRELAYSYLTRVAILAGPDFQQNRDEAIDILKKAKAIFEELAKAEPANSDNIDGLQFVQDYEHELSRPADVER